MTEYEALDKLDKTVTGDLEWKIVLTNALEKQVPKKPWLCRNMMTKETAHACPSCNRIVRTFEAVFFCTFCGQAILWEEEE